jgi:hypothetical protein
VSLDATHQPDDSFRRAGTTAGPLRLIDTTRLDLAATVARIVAAAPEIFRGT